MKIVHLIWIRRVSQVIFLALFIFLLIQSRLPEYAYQRYSIVFSSEVDLRLQFPVRFFFHIDPLVWLSGLLSGHLILSGFLWAFVILILTVFLGRVFCSFICPLGTINHFVSSFRPSLKGDKMVSANKKTSAHKIKYFLLVTVLVGSILGLNFSGFIDPISLLFRSLAIAVFPSIGVGTKEVFDWMARSDVKIVNLMSYVGEIIISPVFGYGYLAYQTGWFIGILFIIILFLNRIRPRFWCRVLCPLGALLGVFSRFSILVPVKEIEKCTDCKLCVKACQGAASPHPSERWENSECLMCFNCSNFCPEGAISFKFRWSSREKRPPDMGRRALLGAFVAGISFPLLSKLHSGTHHASDPRLIRPPGSLPENEFLRLCLRCGLCMKVCPTNALNPAITEGGLAGFWTPRLIMTQGYCEHTCTLCGSVCPTGAIREISVREKIERPIRIGSAFIARGRCLPWSGNGPCIVCEEHCPTSPKAIYLVKEIIRGPDGLSREVQLPYVDLKRCTGCGICENKCPVKGHPAIRVIAAGESRSIRDQILLTG